MSNTKTIAKNSLFLYFRMFLTMAVGLYTSRVVLNTLGVEDFGVYSIVGGIVALFSFFNGAMSSATQRYLAFDIGKQDENQLHKTFNSTFLIHIGIGFLILICGETIGLWYINNRLNIPAERLNAANWVYQFSVITAVVGVVQVPFNALIIARERMSVFALLSIVDAALKLAIVYLLLVIAFDKLILYAILTAGVAILMAITYQVYCRKHFKESSFTRYKDKEYYKELISYSGWNLFGNMAAVAKGQGVNVVLNVFFGTVVNAAYGITMTVQGTVAMFINNFQMAVNPQIIKNYSQNNIDRTRKLIFQSAKFSFFLMLLVCAPILLNTQYILELWLKTLPEFTPVFVQLCLINILIDCISGPLMTGIQATGKIKRYQAVVGGLLFLNLPLAYLVLKITQSPSDVFIISIIISLISLQFRLYYLKKVSNIGISDFYKEVVFKLVAIAVLTAGCFYVLKIVVPDTSNFISFATQSAIIMIIVSSLVVLLGINKDERRFLGALINEKIGRK